MSEILTREQVEEIQVGAMLARAEVLYGEHSDSDVYDVAFGSVSAIDRMTDSHIALHDAHDAALERERVLREAVKWYADPEVWTGKYGSGGSIARAALAAVATPQGQEVNA